MAPLHSSIWFVAQQIDAGPISTSLPHCVHPQRMHRLRTYHHPPPRHQTPMYPPRSWENRCSANRSWQTRTSTSNTTRRYRVGVPYARTTEEHFWQRVRHGPIDQIAPNNGLLPLPLHCTSEFYPLPQISCHLAGAGQSPPNRASCGFFFLGLHMYLCLPKAFSTRICFAAG